MRILVLHGPNLNALGRRPAEHYGGLGLDELNAAIQDGARRLGVSIDCVQSNHEGELVDQLQKSASYDGVVLNAGGFTHTSVAIRDAVESCGKPVIEVHLSNLHARETFRRRSVIAGACRGQISGLGAASYLAALYVLSQDPGTRS
jgi:3-dehydroquinate dehydratase-2